MSDLQAGSAPPKQRDAYWDNVKGVLIILVVFAHLIEQLFSTFGFAKPLWATVYSFHMPAFILVSGYMASRSSKDPVDRVPKMLGYYVAIEVIYTLVDLATGKAKEFSLQILTPRYGCWYLQFLAFFYLAIHYLKEKPRNTMLLAGLLVGLLRGFDPTLTNEGGLVRFANFFLFFLIGYFFDLNLVIDRFRRHKLWSLLAFIAVDSALYMLVVKKWFNRRQFTGAVSYQELYPDQLWRALLMQLVCYAISLLLSLCLFALISRRQSLLTYIGRNSLWIYLAHIVIVSRGYAWLTAHVFDGTRKRGAFYAIAITGAILLAVLGVMAAIQALRRRRLQKRAP